MSRKQRVRVDRELGPIRFCPVCVEWWPDDATFWARLPDRKTLQCKACRVGDRSAFTILALPHDRTQPSLHPNQCRGPSCPVILPPDGRTHCHYHRRML